MIVRLLALLVLPIIAYYFVKEVNQRFNFTPRQTRLLFLIVAALLVIAVLIVLGRLPVGFILAPLGAAAAFVLRFLPTLLRLLPMWQIFKSRTASARPRQEGQTSTIRTEFLAMELEHDTGNMDGEVLKGKFSRKLLSSLQLDELLELYNECLADADSSQVLEAYIERIHPNWREQSNHDYGPAPAPDDSRMDHQLASEVLGLSDPIEKEDVIQAHRKLMQKLHPDRGGSDYLAKKINMAKDFLLNELE
ncbi:MAG: molecular chaperone DnaJ [Gammaproteobacteria bacterium]|nr:molecular chaperone DnaJ [Gammaproteobacteria bacterium]MDD9894770.1 molecular chaperone DnaJ [Gammaproteobacteria bacterium]MDD9957906.1 molecular chaperone DnaJ [Gammaproteobacteria bacterium]